MCYLPYFQSNFVHNFINVCQRLQKEGKCQQLFHFLELLLYREIMSY